MSDRFSRPLSVFLALTVVGACATSIAQDSTPKVRRWLDAQSGMAVRAYFAGIENGVVNLKTRKGDSYSIALERLSTTDRKYVRNLLERESGPPAAAGDGGVPPAIANQQANQQPPDGQPQAQPSERFGIQWYPIDSVLIDEQQADGNLKPANDKPVFWFRVLGDLEGFM